MTSRLTARAGCEDGPLGFEDLAVLHRLRTIALLFRATRAIRPDFAEIEIGLWVDHTGVVHPLGALAFGVCRVIARTLGWEDLLAEEERSVNSGHRLCNATYLRVAADEFPLGCPPRLLSALRRLRGDGVSSAAEVFAATQWKALPGGRRMVRPVLPQHLSALEALDLLSAAEAAGGLGDGPLALLARQAASTLAPGLRP